MKKLAMLLALCLLATALPGLGMADDALNPESAWPEETDLALSEDEAPDASVPELLFDLEAVDEAAEDAPGLALNAMEEALVDASGVDNAGTSDAMNDAAPHTDPLGPKLTANEVALGVAEQFDLAPGLPAGVEGAITLTSSDPAVATVTAEGVVTAVAVGEAVVTATVDGGAYAECFVHVKKAPDKLSFNVKALSIGKGESTGALTVNVGSAEGEFAGSYTLTSSNAKIVRVDANGALKGLKLGKATVKATSYNGKTASCKVTVVKAPSKVTAAADKKTLGVGEAGQASFTLPKGTASQITFTSDDSDIVAVDPLTGAMKGVAVGKTRVYARAFNGKKGYVTVAVAPAPQTLSFDGDVKLGVGMELAAQASLDKGAAGEITYAIENKSVATLKSGKLKGVAQGETVLTAKTYNGLMAQCAVKVSAAPASVKLPYKTLNLGVKQALLLEPDVGESASTYTFSTSNKKIVTVDSNGMIKGVKKGSATITVKTYNKKQFKLKVNVLKAPGSLTLSPGSMELGVDETATFTAKLPKDTAGSVTYASSDPSIAAVDANTGAVTGVAPGQAVVTATTHNGKKTAATVIVYSRPEWITLSDSLIELAAEQTYAIGVELSPGSRSPLRFTSKNAAVASVSQEGVVTGVGAGQTSITVSTNAPGVSAEVYVTVKPAPSSVKLETTELTLNVGETAQMTPVIPEGSVTDYTYATSDEAVATVSQDGKVVATGRGSAKLTVETHNGKKATLKLTVLDPWFPDEVKLLNAPDYMKAGETLQLLWATVPEDAVADLAWESSDKSVATVSETGELRAVSHGYATIRAASRRNTAITLEFTLGVETDDVTLVIPARITNTAGIAKNLEKIDALRASAIKQIDLLQKGGVITAADATKRRSMVNNAFKDYAFPWITLNKQKYWKAENSEGGVKDFKTGQVYYGMPYISGATKNRAYNVAKALKENRYYDSGEGYYILNQNNLLNGKYVGNDCSCFVDAAIWGTGSSHSADRTADIAVSSAYKTVKDYKNLRTGDLICKGAAHVVMFLYYVDAAKTKMMIIENGGIEPGTNTVHCMVMNTKWYTSRGYAVRRLKTLG